LMAAIFVVLFTVEKLWRTRLTFVLLGLGILCGTLLMGFAERLPLSVQRTLSFLPIKIDPMTRQQAESSTEWRLELWKSVLPQVPKYLLMGKGYSYNAEDLFMAQLNSVRAGGVNYEEAAFAGDYHNGPLSVVIPFGAAGAIAFVWLMVAGARFLYSVYQKSPPELRQINAFLLALFLARVLFFFLIFGSLYNEFFRFTGILGFSVALNIAGRREPNEPAESSAPEDVTL
jgi:O-antigen ligase